MSISSSLAHKYDEFDEFAQQSAPKSAYEELKAWCEKHLTPNQWYSHPTILGQSRLTIVDGHTDFFFNADGSLDWIDSCVKRH